MKKLVLALALTTVAAFPAYAAKHSSHTMSSEAQNAYAMQDPDVVVVNGDVVGRDPDPTVRLNLRRDPGLEAD
jgi:lipopolysaccharide export system protein LptA